MRWNSGSPLTLSAGGLNTIWQNAGGNTADILGVLPEGRVTKRTGGLVPTFFEGLTQSRDPGRAAVTAANTLNAAYSLNAIFDAQGNPLLVNPGPGRVGSLGRNIVEGPSRFQLDMNLNKRVRVDERRELEFRVDVINVLNHPVFYIPETNINSANFGQISSAADGRQFVLGARLNF